MRSGVQRFPRSPRPGALWRLARQNLGIDPPKCRERYMVKWDGVPIAVTYDASGENAFAVRLDFDQRKDAEEFGKHFNGASY
jgi:hypothetical protein